MFIIYWGSYFACSLFDEDQDLLLFLNFPLLPDLDTFPQMVRLEAESSERRSTTRRTAEYTHDTEIIFILPSLQMHLKTEHMQGETEPKDTGMNYGH
jgi:Fragile site-associated protein C-terminus